MKGAVTNEKEELETPRSRGSVRNHFRMLLRPDVQQSPACRIGHRRVGVGDVLHNISMDGKEVLTVRRWFRKFMRRPDYSAIIKVAGWGWYMVPRGDVKGR